MKIIQVPPSGWGFQERGSGLPFTPWGANDYDTNLITIGLHQKSAPFDGYPLDGYAAFNPHRGAYG